MATDMAYLMYLTPEAPPARASLPVSLSEAILRERLNPTMVATLWGAMETTEPVCILYRRDDNQISARVIWPERIWVTDDSHVAVRGYDSRRGAVRTFRADRIADAHIIEP
jgi:predicted DNA-binding transcriptional regulator YafY